MKSPVYPQLLEYLKDGVSFWRKYNVHHPFLLPAYGKGDGWKYHSTFSKIGFTSANANEVSFIELIEKPSSGRSALTVHDLDRNHLQRINKAIMDGAAKYAFIPDGVARLMRTSSIFAWLPNTPVDFGSPLKVWKKTDAKTIYWHYHFSVYGAFEQRKREQLRAISELIKT